jgi:hypothetical protein
VVVDAKTSLEEIMKSLQHKIVRVMTDDGKLVGIECNFRTGLVD